MSEEEASKTPLAKVEFELGQFALDFLRDYLKFLGSNETVEDVARTVFFEEICSLRDKLRDMPHQQDGDFFKKYPYVGLLESREEQKRLAELEKRSGC